MKPSGTASSASVRRPNRAGANPVAPTDAGRSTGRRAADSAPSRTAPSPSQTRILIPQTVPKRVSSTSPMIWLSSADQKETPAAVAPCSTMPAMPLSTPVSTASSSAVRAPDAKRSEASRHWALAACDERERRQPDRDQEEDRSDRDRDRRVLDSARHSERHLGHLADVALLREQLRDGRAGRRSPSRRRTPGHRTPGGCRPRSRGRWRCSCPSRAPASASRPGPAPCRRDGRPRRSRRARPCGRTPGSRRSCPRPAR